MHPALKYFVCGWFAVACADAGRPRPPHEESLFLFENRKVTLAVPADFGFVVHKSDDGIYQVKLGDPKNRVSIDIVFLPDPEEQFKTARARREMLYAQFGDYVGSSSEKGMQFEELEPRVGSGTYCVFTDDKLVDKTDLPPGEYLHLTAGVKAWPGVMAIFRLFSNETGSPEYRAMLTMLRQSVEERPVPLK